jgi:hypothetical protein
MPAECFDRLRTGTPCSYGCPDITSHLAVVNQRLMSPYFGDLAEWLCKAFGSLVRWLVASPGFHQKVFRASLNFFQCLN